MNPKVAQIQRILEVADDGIWGPHTQAALDALIGSAPPGSSQQQLDLTTWHEGHASSFADPADVRAFKRCKAEGHSDEFCFAKGDNGIGKWGADTTIDRPMVALPPEDWSHLPHPAGTPVAVEINNRVVIAELQDTMPHKANITNGAILDMNPACCAAFGLTPPVMVPVRWRWA